MTPPAGKAHGKAGAKDSDAGPTTVAHVEPSYDITRCVSEFLEKLADRRRHVSFLIGSGCSKAVGLPDISELGQKVAEALSTNEQVAQAYESLSNGRNIEEVLTRIRAIGAVVDETNPSIGGLSATGAKDLDGAICGAIHQAVSIEPQTLEHHRKFAGSLARSGHDLPVEVFTINYDLLLERGLEAAAVPYFDGFVGSIEGAFRPDLVDSVAGSASSMDSLQLPRGWVRLWKLHGSVSWRLLSTERRIVRVASPTLGSDQALAIYPSHQKYEESRRVPFVTLFDRFRRALETPESVTVTCGYSFGDQHINETLFDAAERFPRSEVVALFRSTAPEFVADRAKAIPNLTVIDSQQLILGTTRYQWLSSNDNPQWLWQDDKFCIGEFTTFVRALSSGSGTQANVDG